MSAEEPHDIYPVERPPQAAAQAADRPGWLGFALWVLILVLIVLYVVPYAAQRIAYSISRGQELARAEVARQELKDLPADASRLPKIVKIMEPSVVGIQTAIRRRSPFGNSDWFGPDVEAMAQGSGVIVDPAGYILTNAHVISQAARGGVTVQLSDGRSIDSAAIVGVDPATDLAVLKINAGKLTAAAWGDSAALEVGDRVLAIGSPYGLQETVTEGIISAKNRKVGIQNVGHEDFLQTDAAINPGNSGGPLVNMNAQLIGINTAIVGHGNQGIGFAIPSELAKKVYDLLRTSGIARGWIGVATVSLNKSLAERFHLTETSGALIAETVPDSPAEDAGLKPGDVIVKWDSKPIDNSNDLRVAAAQSKPGSKVSLTFYRASKRQKATITVGTRPSQVEQ
jgi:serine protease Do